MPPAYAEAIRWLLPTTHKGVLIDIRRDGRGASVRLRKADSSSRSPDDPEESDVWV
jgi:hypothetical protein